MKFLSFLLCFFFFASVQVSSFSLSFFERNGCSDPASEFTLLGTSVDSVDGYQFDRPNRPKVTFALSTEYRYPYLKEVTAYCVQKSDVWLQGAGLRAQYVDEIEVRPGVRQEVQFSVAYAARIDTQKPIPAFTCVQWDNVSDNAFDTLENSLAGYKRIFARIHCGDKPYKTQ